MRKAAFIAFLLVVAVAIPSCSGSKSDSVTYRPTTTRDGGRRSAGGYEQDTRPRGAGPNLFRLPMTNGQTVTVQAPAALYFFTTWCGYCKQALPEVKRQAEIAQRRGMRVYGIDVNENAGAVNQYIQQYQPNFPVLLDERALVADRYGVRGYPTFIIIDESGNIVYNDHAVPTAF